MRWRPSHKAPPLDRLSLLKSQTVEKEAFSSGKWRERERGRGRERKETSGGVREEGRKGVKESRKREKKTERESLEVSDLDLPFNS